MPAGNYLEQLDTGDDSKPRGKTGDNGLEKGCCFYLLSITHRITTTTPSQSFRCLACAVVSSPPFPIAQSLSSCPHEQVLGASMWQQLPPSPTHFPSLPKLCSYAFLTLPRDGDLTLMRSQAEVTHQVKAHLPHGRLAGERRFRGGGERKASRAVQLRQETGNQVLTQRHCTSGEGGQLGSPLQRERGTRGPGQGILYLLFSPPPKLWIQAITPHLPQRAKLPPKASAKESIRILQHRELPKSHFLRPPLSLFHFVHSHFSCLARHKAGRR